MTDHSQGGPNLKCGSDRRDDPLESTPEVRHPAAAAAEALLQLVLRPPEPFRGGSQEPCREIAAFGGLNNRIHGQTTPVEGVEGAEHAVAEHPCPAVVAADDRAGIVAGGEASDELPHRLDVRSGDEVGDGAETSIQKATPTA